MIDKKFSFYPRVSATKTPCGARAGSAAASGGEQQQQQFQHTVFAVAIPAGVHSVGATTAQQIGKQQHQQHWGWRRQWECKFVGASQRHTAVDASLRKQHFGEW